MINHAELPAIATAQLPERYEAAKIALVECERVDECKTWSDQAAALASYAKQSKDTELEKLSMRIRARAVRRCGELLGEIEKAKGGQPFQKSTKGDTPPSRSQAASDAGLSPDQAKQALRVANVPHAEFEAQVESENPPTITSLAEQGTQKREKPIDVEAAPVESRKPRYEQLGMTLEEFQSGMYFRGNMREYMNAIDSFDPQTVVNGSEPDDREWIREAIGKIEVFHNKLRALI